MRQPSYYAHFKMQSTPFSLRKRNLTSLGIAHFRKIAIANLNLRIYVFDFSFYSPFYILNKLL